MFAISVFLVAVISGVWTQQIQRVTIQTQRTRPQDEWNTFKITFNKTYSNDQEETLRRDIFFSNIEQIRLSNREFELGRSTFIQRLNPFADMLLTEFNRAKNGYNRTINNVIIPISSTFIPAANVIYPDYVDWREVGGVSSVKDQGSCAGCWAFSATGALEGHQYRKTGQLIELSPQNLIDCTRNLGNDGCEGGLVEPAYEYVRSNPGIDTLESYPYEAQNGPCRFRPETVGAICTGYVGIGQNDEKGLEAAVATLGPVSAAIDASRLQFYSTGVYNDPLCGKTPDEMNHAVLIVGYGTEPDGQRYWLVKNSYGPQWGIGGYIKMAKDANNNCGIATQASYPLV